MIIRSAIVAATFGSAIVLTADSMSPRWLAGNRDGRSEVSRPVSILFDQYLLADPIDPAPAPLPELDALPTHGPSLGVVLRPVRSSSSATVEWEFGCYFTIWDENENYWDFAYEARLFRPDNSQITSETSWAYKPSFSSELSRTLTDPESGTYKCTIDWWVNSAYAGKGEATVSISYQTPTGENTASGGWWPLNDTVYRWNQTLTGGSFNGRRVTEQDPGGGGPDTCWFPGSQYAKFEAVTTPGFLWTVGSGNAWGPDYVGWTYSAVSYYRGQGREPCDTTVSQDMMINSPGSADVKYVTNTLRAGFSYSTVWSERAGQFAERIWP